jgi:hypothetical protein
MASFSTSSEAAIFLDTQLIRRSSSSFEPNEQTAASADEQQKTDSQANVRFKELQKLLDGPIGEQIISSIDYKQLQQKILNSISQILQRASNKQSMIFEEKLIVENALSLLVGCALHKNELFVDFLQTADHDQFVLRGLLYCT